MKIRYKILALLIILSLILVGCGDTDSDTDKRADLKSDDPSALRIVSGSENSEFEHIIQDYVDQSGNEVSIDYMGSLDIMRLLQSGDIEYDAVWPASSIWLDLGDDHRLLKHQEVISVSPVAFGIRESLAESLGFESGSTTTRDIVDAISRGDLSFAMTSATQSNSGASAYLGFLTALTGKDEALTMADLNNSQVQEDIKTLLSGVNRSSGSSNWLVDLFLSGNYDAMVNYEALIIKTNELLEEEGREALRLIYPVDGLAISDSPLAYVEDANNPRPDKEEIFLDFQTYMTSDEVQSRIEQTGRRSALGTVEEANRPIYEKWGIDLDQVIKTIRFPESDVIFEALNLYQGEFKKPAFTVYVLDYSGSMAGQGQEELVQALSQVLIQENAKANLLQASANDETVIIPFHDQVLGPDVASGNGQELEGLYDKVQGYSTGGGTNLFEAVDAAMAYLHSRQDELDAYIPAIVVLTDGMANGAMTLEEFANKYETYQMDIPIFSILFASADEIQMQGLAQISNARVFDGRDDLVEAFRAVKGYN